MTTIPSGKETGRPRLGLAGLMGPRANLELGCKGLDGFGEAEAVARAARRAASATQDDTSVYDCATHVHLAPLQKQQFD